jgi:hypothetical protein
MPSPLKLRRGAAGRGRAAAARGQQLKSRHAGAQSSISPERLLARRGVSFLEVVPVLRL